MNNKLFISADMEGLACVSDRTEVNKAEAAEYAPAREQMTAEVAAACDGAHLAGDKALCEEAAGRVNGIVTVPAFEGEGPSITTITPSEAVRRVRDGVQRAVEQKAGHVLSLPAEFTMRLTYTAAAEAYRKSFYPGAKLVADNQVEFGSAEYFEILRFLGFMVM